MQPGIEGPLFLSSESRRPTGYVVTFDPFDTGGTTELTLAFPAEIDNVPGRLDLAGGFDLLTFAEDLTGIVAPMFVDAAAMNPENLFVSVDLVQWLSASTPYTSGQPFSIIEGTSEQLPGYSFLFQTPSMTFEPFEGVVRVAGNVDGASVVPEPSTLLLFGIGGFGFLAYGRQQHKVGQGEKKKVSKKVKKGVKS